MGRSSIDLKDKGRKDKRKGHQSRLGFNDQSARSNIVEGRQVGRAKHPEQQADQSGAQNQQQAGQQQAMVRAAPAVAMPTFKMVINRPQAIVIDLLGVLVCRSFMSSSKEFRDFFQHNVLEYLNDNWKQKQLKIMINFFRCGQQSVPDEYKLADREEAKEDQIRQARKHVIWKLRNEPTNSALSLFMLGITEWGYKNRMLQTAIYDEVPHVLRYWKDQLKVPVYVGVGSADFLVMVLTNTIYGNILPFFDGHMNIMDFDGQRASKDFRKLTSLLKMAPEKILYLTRFRQDCRRAMESGMQSLIVLRSDFDSHGLVRELKTKRANQTVADGTRARIPDEANSPPAGHNLGADAKNPDIKNQVEKNISSLSLIDDHEDTDRYNTQSSQIVEQDLNRYNIVLSLSEIAFK